MALFRFCIPVGTSHLYAKQRAVDYFAAEAALRAELSRPVSCMDDSHLVPAAEVSAAVTPATLIWREGPGAVEGRAAGGEWWIVNENNREACRIVNGGEPLFLRWRDVNTHIEWLVVHGDRIIGERHEGDHFRSYEFYPFTWADAMFDGFHVERANGVLTAVRADGVRHPLQ